MTTIRGRCIARNFGIVESLAESVVLVACKEKLPLHYACALLEMESGCRNVFGHDPTTSIPDSWKGTNVTRAKYLWYRLRRGKGYQGVGPCQLTWGGFQDKADKIGGCWRPAPNMHIGFGHLRDLIQRYGITAGAAAYNGSGPAAEAYGKRFAVAATRWQSLLP